MKYVVIAKPGIASYCIDADGKSVPGRPNLFAFGETFKASKPAAMLTGKTPAAQNRPRLTAPKNMVALLGKWHGQNEYIMIVKNGKPLALAVG